MQSKATTKCDFPSTKFAKSKNSEIPSVSRNVINIYFVYCWWECKLVDTLHKTIWHYLVKVNVSIGLQSNNFTPRYVSPEKPAVCITTEERVIMAALSVKEQIRNFVSASEQEKRIRSYSHNGILRNKIDES